MIELPPTIRLPRADEVPTDASVTESLQNIRHAKIVQGYKLLDNKEDEATEQIPFSFYAEISIDNSRLWHLLHSLSGELPETASLIFGYEGEELHYSEALNKHELLTGLAEFSREIVQDTYIEVGLTYNDEAKLVEIIIADAKYVKFWGTDKEAFVQIMRVFGLEEIEDLEFVDEYPNVREPLTAFAAEAMPTDELISRLKERYLAE
ncbi:hypothetical protein [Pontibacter mangrovi]|uniref:Uncharacterized protein n=1 Tax=Pontibacter mangrovi TaxID=2589816 RepID=A0A501W5Y1_9BACT|nr:hypothetical protein [Pontibacter mangrovi]TPE44688.1 hypothetical protein FJM65_06570 [Pontibacter mangrovi]